MTIFQIIAIVFTFAAMGGYVNYKLFRLPSTIGHMVFALIFSVLVLAAGKVGIFDVEIIRELIGRIDFSDLVLHGMLSFLLFAGALQINLNDLKNVRVPVSILATFGVFTATAITGTLTWYLAGLAGVNLPYVYALLFGALISPTDPIAVLSILKQLGVSKTLYMKIGGESLFNDGVGVVIFLSLLGLASGGADLVVHEFFIHLAREAVGGLALGLLLGWITYKFMQSIDDYKTETMLTLALVSGGYVLAESLHISAPLCMVAAGLVIGNQARQRGMSDLTREHVDTFWQLLDEIMNDVLFLLIGLEMIIISFSKQTILVGLGAIVAVLAGRFISVGLPIAMIRLRKQVDRGTIRMMTWGGLRGGLSIALALSLPEGEAKSIILTLTYMVVLFSIMVQGTTFKKLYNYISK